MDHPYLTRTSVNSRSEQPRDESEPVVMGYVKSEPTEEISYHSGNTIDGSEDVSVGAACFSDPQIELGDIKVLAYPTEDLGINDKRPSTNRERKRRSDSGASAIIGVKGNRQRFVTCDQRGPRAPKKKATNKRKFEVGSVSDAEISGGSAKTENNTGLVRETATVTKPSSKNTAAATATKHAKMSKVSEGNRSNGATGSVKKSKLNVGNPKAKPTTIRQPPQFPETNGIIWPTKGTSHSSTASASKPMTSSWPATSKAVSDSKHSEVRTKETENHKRAQLRPCCVRIQRLNLVSSRGTREGKAISKPQPRSNCATPPPPPSSTCEKLLPPSRKPNRSKLQTPPKGNTGKISTPTKTNRGKRVPPPRNNRGKSTPPPKNNQIKSAPPPENNRRKPAPPLKNNPDKLAPPPKNNRDKLAPPPKNKRGKLPPPPPPVQTTPETSAEPPLMASVPLEPPIFNLRLQIAISSTMPYAYGTFPVDSSTQEFQAIKELVWPLRLTSVEQIVHPELWQQYQDRYKQIFVEKSPDRNLMTKYGMPNEIIQVARRNLLREAAKYSPNETILFHYPLTQNLQKLLIYGPHSTANFGKTSEFRVKVSDDPRFCSTWNLQVEPFDTDEATTGTLLIFSVLLGDCDTSFDSLTTRTEWHSSERPLKKYTSNEYVIFHKSQCYPLYMVKYRFSETMGDCADEYALAREEKPSISWNQPADESWPMFAKSLYKRMETSFKVDPKPSVTDLQSPSVLRKSAFLDLESKLISLKKLGFMDVSRNVVALKKFNCDVVPAMDFLNLVGNPARTSSDSTSEEYWDVLCRTSLGRVLKAPPHLKNGNGSISISRSAALPPDWIEKLDAAHKTNSKFHILPVCKLTKEYATIAQLLHPIPVSSIEKVINPNLWEQYEAHRKMMLLQKSNDEKLLISLGMEKGTASLNVKNNEQYVKDNRVLLHSEPYAPNEALLLHATGRKRNLRKILCQGLDETSTDGNGIHFWDDPIATIQFDGTFKEEWKGKEMDDTGTILIFTVLLGDSLSLDNLSRQGRDSPMKHRVQMRNHDDFTFDSVTARTSFRDFANARDFCNKYVIFNKEQCYPLYMVKYRRNQIVESSTENEYDIARQQLPTMAWRDLPVVKTPMPNQFLDESWPFYSEVMYRNMSEELSRIGRDYGDSLLQRKLWTVPISTVQVKISREEREANVGQLIDMGFSSRGENLAALQDAKEDLQGAIDIILRRRSESQSSKRCRAEDSTPRTGYSSCRIRRVDLAWAVGE